MADILTFIDDLSWLFLKTNFTTHKQVRSPRILIFVVILIYLYSDAITTAYQIYVYLKDEVAQ